MPCCAVNGCSIKKFNKNVFPPITLHRFPKDEVLREKWVKAVGRADWQPTEYSRLCSQHFLEEDIDRSLLRTYIKNDRVPSVFPVFPSYLQTPKPKKGKRKIPVDESDRPDSQKEAKTDDSSTGFSDVPMKEEPMDSDHDESEKSRLRVNDDFTEPSLTNSSYVLSKCDACRSDIPDEFDHFSKCLAVQLRKLPLRRALACMEKLQEIVKEDRLANHEESVEGPFVYEVDTSAVYIKEEPLL